MVNYGLVDDGSNPCRSTFHHIHPPVGIGDSFRGSKVDRSMKLTQATSITKSLSLLPGIILPLRKYELYDRAYNFSTD